MPVSPTSSSGTTDDPAAEVLGNGSERVLWRPPRRAVRLATVTALVLAAAGGGSAWAWHEHGLDARAAAQVQLLAGSLVEQEAAGERFQLLNATDLPVHVVSVRFAGAGYPAGSVDDVLAARSELDVVVPQGTRCPQSLLTSGPQAMVVTVRTSRGKLARKDVALGADSVATLDQAERARCGYLLPQEAVTYRADSSRRVGRTVVVEGSVQNSSRVAVIVDELAPVPGAHASASLPLVVPGAVNGAATAMPLTLVLQVTDCRTFAQSVLYPPVGQQADQVLAVVHSDYGHGQVRLDLTQGVVSPEAGTTDQTNDPLTMLASLCPAAVFAASPA